MLSRPVCLWGTGGFIGSLLGRSAGLSAVAVAAYRLTAGGILIVLFLVVARRPLPRGRSAWTRIVGIGLLAALFQCCYFAAVSLTSVSLATFVTIGASPVIVLLLESILGRRRSDSPRLPSSVWHWSALACWWVCRPMDPGRRRCWPERVWRSSRRAASPS